MSANQNGPWTGQERRQYPRRVITELGARYRRAPGSDGWQVAISGNVSEGGIHLLTREFLPEGTLLTIELETPRRQTFVCVGTVVWNQEPNGATGKEVRHGIAFVSVGDASRAAFRAFLDAAMPQGVSE